MTFNPPLPSIEFQNLVRKELDEADARARESLGLRRKSKLNRGQKRYWTDERIIRAIRVFHFHHGRIPKSDEWNNACPNHSHPGKAMIQRRFGTFNQAIVAAGFEPRKSGAQPEQKGKRRGPYKTKGRQDFFHIVDQGVEHAAKA